MKDLSIDINDIEDEGIEISDNMSLPFKKHSYAHFLTEMGNGARIALAYSDVLKYTTHWGYLIWNGKYWEKDDKEKRIELAKEMAMRIWDEKNQYEIDQQMIKDPKSDLFQALEKKIKAVKAWAIKSQEKKTMYNSLALAQSEPGIISHQKEFDLDLHKINLENGLYDLEEGIIEAHKSSMKVTKIMNASLSSSECPTWISFLKRIFNNNEEIINFIQKAVGYSLSGSVKEQCLFFLYGLGRNGKSTFCNLLLDLFGDYGMKTTAESLLVKQSAGIPNDIARLHGARLVVASELSEKRLNEGLIKDLTGGDKISARFLHKEFFEFYPQFKLWMYGNEKPTIKGTDDGIWRRIRLIPFNVQIPENEVDVALPDKLKAELPGILAWAIEGYKKYKRDGLKAPKEIMEATESYRQEQDILTSFISECCIEKAGGECPKKDFYNEYILFSGSKESQRKVADQMSKRYESRRDKHTHYWVGLSLTKDVEKREKENKAIAGKG